MGVKELFWKSDKPEEKKPAQTAQTAQPAPVPYVPPVSAPQIVTEDFTVFCQQLTDALEAANMPGQDYMDLKQALKNMANLSMTEETKFQAIFATMSTGGADAQSFLQSFDYYKDVLSGEKQKFDDAIEAAMSDSVHAKQSELEKLTDVNAKNAAEIKRLSDEINSNNTQITTLQVDISSANSKLEQKKQNFEAAYQKVTKEIDDDSTKSQKYVGMLPTAPVAPTKPSTRKTTSSRKEK